MPASSVSPLILGSERQRGGELHLRLRLSDGRTAIVVLPAGELTEQLLAELDPVLLARLVPHARVAGQPAGVPPGQQVRIATADPGHPKRRGALFAV